MVLRHEGADDNLQDIFARFSGASFDDIQAQIREFIRQYNLYQTSREPGEKTLMDWTIADSAEINSNQVQVYSYAHALAPEDEEDD